jgi:hypothetical protein
MSASVVTSSSQFTTIAPPMAASPLASAPAIARFWSEKFAVARTVTPAVELMSAPSPIFASVSKSTTITPMDPAMPSSESPVPAPGTCAAPPAAARPREIRLFLKPSGVTASTVTPTALTVVAPPISAVLVASSQLKPIAAPTFVSHSESSAQSARPIACATTSVWLIALTVTLPLVALMTSPGPIRAMLVVTTQLNAIAAATPTLPPDCPDSASAVVFAWSTAPSADGGVAVDAGAFVLPWIC